MTEKKPLIGVTIDYSEGGEDKYSLVPFYILRKNYIDAINDAGAIPILIPHIAEQIDYYVDLVDGMLFTGGDFDIPPNMYNEEPHPKTVFNEQRANFEIQLMQKFLATKKPLLGICAGMQLLNVIYGGSLIQHIPDLKCNNPIDHSTPFTIPKTEPRHKIEILLNTKFGQIYNVKDLDVNSTHHQAVKDIPPGLQICATAPDGIIEAIEIIDHPFAIAVEWHPEYYVTQTEKKLFNAFVKAADIHDKNQS